jgi:hypothetical protein
LAVQKEWFVVEDEEDSGGRGCEVFQVAAFDAERTFAAIVGDS